MSDKIYISCLMNRTAEKKTTTHLKALYKQTGYANIIMVTPVFGGQKGFTESLAPLRNGKLLPYSTRRKRPGELALW